MVIFSTLLLNFWMSPGVIPCPICPMMFIPKSGCGLKTWHLREFFWNLKSSWHQKKCVCRMDFELWVLKALRTSRNNFAWWSVGGCVVSRQVSLPASWLWGMTRPNSWFTFFHQTSHTTSLTTSPFRALMYWAYLAFHLLGKLVFHPHRDFAVAYHQYKGRFQVCK